MKSTLSTLCMLAGLSSASAAAFSISNPGSITANGGSGNLVATAFDLSENQTATQLGVYAPGGIIVDTLVVSLWSGGTLGTYSSSSAALATVTFNPATYSVNAAGYVFLPISSVSLFTTQDYALSVSGYGVGPGSRNQIGFGGGDPTPLYSGATAQIDLAWDGVGNPYHDAAYNSAGNGHNIASFSTTPVPEPETCAMLAGLGLVGFGLYRRCRK